MHKRSLKSKKTVGSTEIKNSRPLNAHQMVVFLALFVPITVYIIVRGIAATPNALPGDINGDSTVNTIDLSIVLSNFGSITSQASNPNADINGDGNVNITDLSVLLTNFGKTATVANLPFTGIASGQTLSGGIIAQANTSGISGVAKVDFTLDNNVIRSEVNAPFCIGGDNGTSCVAWDTTTVANGPHSLIVKAYDSSGTVLAATPSITFTVSNTSTTPPPTTPPPTTGGSACTNSSKPAGVVWCSGFENGTLSDWSSVQACPGGVSVVTSPVKNGKYAAKFTVSDGDTNAKCSAVPTDNPRAQLVAPNCLFPPCGSNGDVYIGWSVYFPTGFPNITGWFELEENYGAPFGGSPPTEMDVQGTKFSMQLHQSSGYVHPWVSTNNIKIGQWNNIVEHIKWSTDPSVGYIELWLDGVQQKFSNGNTRYNYAPIVSSINGQGNTVFLNQYRQSGTGLGTVTLYQDDLRVGTTYDSVSSGR
jgi:hypothetical protein